MPKSQAELIIHPIRLRILQALLVDELTTQEIADRLAGVPVSSIYRHVRVLLGAGLVAVATTRPVKGVEEKVYRLPRQPHLGPADMAGLGADDYLRYFTTYLVTLLRDFDQYLHAAPPDLFRDLAGFTEVVVYASDMEFMEATMAFNNAIVPLMQHGPGAGRTRRKLASVTHPIRDPAPTSGEDEAAPPDL